MGDLPTELELALSQNYRIIRELGGGGMSRVFLAVELALDREVVIKVLPPELAVGVSTDRFRREMQLAARLQHPHVVPILSTGSAGDVLYYAMPFIKGESLRARLARDGALPVDEAATILREVADALSFAHAQGVVHRDIKPDNVLLTSGHALVTDFGVAKALGVGEVGDEAGGLTSIGMALGTPTYMAPEQGAADPHVDHRADIYAFGVMAYEMLAGQPPFIAPTPQALIAAHFGRAPESLRLGRPSIPEAFDELVLRCLAKHPPDRYQRAADLIPLLDQLAHPNVASASTRASQAPPGASPSRTPALAAGGVVLMLAGAWLLRETMGLPDWAVIATVALLAIGVPLVLRVAARGRAPSTAAGPMARLTSGHGLLTVGAVACLGLVAAGGLFMGLRALGVGPFATLLSTGKITERDPLLIADFGNTTPDTLLGESLTEALRIDLSQTKVVRLMTTTEVRDALTRMQRDAGMRLTPDVAAEVAAREGVKVIVAGDIAPFAGGFVLSARVLDPQGASLFATRATADGPSEILPALETVSRELRQAIGESVRSIRGTQSLEQVTTQSLEALRLYTRAVRSKEAGEDLDRLPLLRQAVALDSSFAMAWRSIAAELINTNGDANALLEAAEQARRFKDRLPAREALQAEALYSQIDGDWERGIEASRRILASWPDDMQARNSLGLYLRAIGRFRDSEQVYLPSVETGTATVAHYHNLATSQIPQGRFDAAARTLQLLRERFPRSPMVWRVEIYLASATNRFDDVLAAADSLARGGVGTRYFGHLHRAETEALRGRLLTASRSARAAVEALREQANSGGALLEELSWIWTDFQLVGDTAAARARTDRVLAANPLDSFPPASRPYGELIRMRAALGQLAEARRLESEYVRMVPAPVRAGDDFGARGLAQLSLASRRFQDAITLARRAARGCGGCTADVVGAAFERMGEVDSAIVAYEEALRPPIYGSNFRHWRPAIVPRALFRLGELYEQRGERSLARDRFAAFADLWQNAEPPLRPVVVAVRDRLKALAGEGEASRGVDAVRGESARPSGSPTTAAPRAPSAPGTR